MERDTNHLFTSVDQGIYGLGIGNRPFSGAPTEEKAPNISGEYHTLSQKKKLYLLLYQVCPLSLLEQWKEEAIKRTQPNTFKICIHHGILVVLLLCAYQGLILHRSWQNKEI